MAHDPFDAAGMYRAVPQIDNPRVMRPTMRLIGPDEARGILLKADSDPDFHQRPVSQRDVRRWEQLMRTDRFVSFLPNGPLCFDDRGLLINGKHRLTGLTRQERPHGFVVFDNVPRWMFKYFDTMRPRSLNDVFAIGGRMTGTQTGSTMRLAMRYEEFLFGKRSAHGWRDWNGVRDEHADVDEFRTRREELTDWYGDAAKSYPKSKIVIAAQMVFRMYQQLAWPENGDKLQEFWTALAGGTAPAPDAPALVLRDWARDRGEARERIAAKRELHLLLLFEYFAQHAQGLGIETDGVRWGYGLPMALPFHPDGPEVALENVKRELERMNDEAESITGVPAA
ncbi:hypothetical protein AB0K00_00180 [Dactylosporangium sp. NPDC049525]|uniref:hypothetical protein n=1 Tax=Dactylosporangium sp. NPDC049525 TaxID=3154730 RepID=UPI0034353D00